MAHFEDLLGKGLQFTKADLDEAKYRISQLSPEQRAEIEGDVYEGITLIISDPDYLGEVTVEDLG